jgi:hypothetical protein
MILSAVHARHRARRETSDARIGICVQYWKPKSDAPSDRLSIQLEARAAAREVAASLPRAYVGGLTSKGRLAAVRRPPFFADWSASRGTHEKYCRQRWH